MESHGHEERATVLSIFLVAPLNFVHIHKWRQSAWLALSICVCVHTRVCYLHLRLSIDMHHMLANFPFSMLFLILINMGIFGKSEDRCSYKYGPADCSLCWVSQPSFDVQWSYIVRTGWILYMYKNMFEKRRYWGRTNAESLSLSRARGHTNTQHTRVRIIHEPSIPLMGFHELFYPSQQMNTNSNSSEL